MQHLRSLGIAGIGSPGDVYAGAILATLPATDPAPGTGFLLSGRRSIPGDGGSYGLHYQGVPEGQTARSVAWLHGLRQDDENRSDLALVNTGESDGSDDVFDIEIWDGPLAAKVTTLHGVVVPARHWLQLNGIPLERGALASGGSPR